MLTYITIKNLFYPMWKNNLNIWGWVLNCPEWDPEAVTDSSIKIPVQSQQ